MESHVVPGSATLSSAHSSRPRLRRSESSQHAVVLSGGHGHAVASLAAVALRGLLTLAAERWSQCFAIVVAESGTYREGFSYRYLFGV